MGKIMNFSKVFKTYLFFSIFLIEVYSKSNYKILTF